MSNASRDFLPKVSRLGFAIFCCASFGAVLVGLMAAQANHVPVGKLVINGVAWAAGAMLATGLAKSAKSWPPTFFVLPALFWLAGSFFFGGLEGVHRWVGIGPLRFNSAELTLPLAIAGLPRLALQCWASLGIVSVFGLMLALQPDASQAAGLAVAVGLVLLVLELSWTERILAAVLPVLAVVVALGRPDPLLPVAEVEGIVGLAFGVSPVLGLAGVGLLVAAAGAPLAWMRSGDSTIRAASVGLTGYFAVVTLAPLLGAFPVPLMGMGVSSIVGSWLGIGLLCRDQ